MKKIIALTVVLLLASAGAAFAETATAGQTIYGCGTTPCTADATNTLIGKLSTGVQASWTTNVNGYAIATLHENGSQAYGTAHDSTSLYRSETTTLPTISQTGSAAFGNGWTSL